MRLVDFIIADDVRREMGNKISIMGVFNEGISIELQPDATWPILFRLGLFIRIQIEDSDEVPDRFNFNILLNDNVIAEMNGTINNDGGDRPNLITLPFVANPLPLPSLGTLNFQLEISRGEKSLFTTSNPYPVEIT